MTTPAVMQEASFSVAETPRAHTALRISCWAVALAMSAAQAWATRFTVNADGVSYLDIGDAYWRGDWHNAINPYWSPLYSWILGFSLKALKPSTYWEYPVVHIVNFLILAAALAAFDFFLATAISYGRRMDRCSLYGIRSMPEPALWLLGYSLFLDSSLAMVGVNLVTPDMCVAAFVFLASAVLLKIRISTAEKKRRLFVLLGFILGLAYLAKAVMLPLGVVFLATAIVAGRASPGLRLNAALSVLAFLVITGPFLVAISRAAGRPTFGESGRLTYAATLNGIDAWTPGNSVRITQARSRLDAHNYGRLKHPATKISDEPEAFWFGEPIPGTYPLWYNPAYWQDGVTPHFDLAAELRQMTKSLKVYVGMITTRHLSIIVPFFALLLISHAPTRLLRILLTSWVLFVPSLSGLLLYFVVQTEYRYIAAFVAVLGVVLFQALHFAESEKLPSFLIFTSVAIAAATIWSVARTVRYDAVASQPAASYWRAAEALSASGLHRTQSIAAIGREPGRDGAYVGRLAKLRIIAQVNEPDRFWTAPPSAQEKLLTAFRDAGCAGVLAWGVRDPSPPWRHLGTTEYFFFPLLPATDMTHTSDPENR